MNNKPVLTFLVNGLFEIGLHIDVSFNFMHDKKMKFC